MPDASTRTYSLLMVDDDREFLAASTRMLSGDGFVVTKATSAPQALERINSDADSYDVMMLDVGLGDANGLDVLAHVKARAPLLPVIMVSADATAGTATRALKLGAFDYHTKPIADYEEFVLVLQRAAGHGQLLRRTRELEQRVGEIDEYRRTIIGRSPAMKQVFEAISKLAATSVNVLVLGESGTGKELVARAIHDRSERTNRPFVALNCAGLPEGLIDSELFGHARGAFTGAVSARTGAFERARSGSLFLDEIGDLPLSVQGRLLRVLQEGETQAVGADEVKQIDVRVIAATLVDLKGSVARREFREDLYYRLNVVSLIMPPLRDRMEDLPLLVAFFLRKHAELAGGGNPRVTPEAFEALRAYRWPGNVRELENAIQRALALSADRTVHVDTLPPEVAAAVGATGAPRPPRGEPTAWSLEMSFAEARLAAQRDFERTYLVKVLEITRGNVTAASRNAGMDRSNFRKLLQRNGLDPQDYR